MLLLLSSEAAGLIRFQAEVARRSRQSHHQVRKCADWGLHEHRSAGVFESTHFGDPVQKVVDSVTQFVRVV